MDVLIQAIKRFPVIHAGPALAIAACCLATAVAAHYLRPTHTVERDNVKLDAVLLPQAGGWREVKSNLVQMSLTPDGTDLSRAVAASYDDTAMTSYADAEGNVVMVALAYGRLQRQEGKIHRPELCYSAQGYAVDKSAPVPLAGLSSNASEPVLVHRLMATGRDRREIVSYWIRIGDLFSTSAFQTRTYIMKTGLEGKIPDGVLFRVSQVVPGDLSDAALQKAYARQEEFMSVLAKSLKGGAQQMLLGDRLTTGNGDLHATP